MSNVVPALSTATPRLAPELWSLVFRNVAGDMGSITCPRLSALVPIMQVCRVWQAIVQPVLFADLHVPAGRFKLLLDRILAHECHGSHPGIHTHRLHVHGESTGAEELLILMALLLYLPNLRTFLARDYVLEPLAALTLRQHGQHLQTLDISFKMNAASSVLSEIGHLDTLHTLRIEFECVRRYNVDPLAANAPLVLPRLANFQAALSGRLFPSLARWLTCCQLPVLDHLLLTSQETEPLRDDLGGLAEFEPFFAIHQGLQGLTISAFEDITRALLARQLPPCLRRLTLPGPDALPSTLPALPLSLQQLVLTVHADPDDSGLWDCLAYLLLEPTLSLVKITVAFDGDAMALLNNMGDFSWHHLLSPPCGLDLSNDHDVLIRGKMMLYALEFRKRGISIVDGYGSVWPSDADAGLSISQRHTP